MNVELIGIFEDLMTPCVIFNTVAGTLFSMSVCLYCVMSLKHNRIMMSIVWTIVTNICIGFVGGLVGAFSGFRQGLADGMAGVERRGSAEIMQSVGLSSFMQTYCLVAGVVLTICTIFVIIKTYNVIKNRQI